MSTTIDGSAGITTNAGGSVNPSTNIDGINYSCRAWVNFNGTTAAINASANVASVTRTAAGTFTVTFTTAMSDANYVAIGTTNSTQYLRAVQTASSATGSVVVRTVTEAASPSDTSGNVHVAIFR